MSVIFHDRLPDLLMKKVPLSTRARSKSSESHNWRKCRQIGPDSGGSQICFWQTGRRPTGKCSTHKRRSLSQRTHQKSTHKNIFLTERVTRSLPTKDLSLTEQHKSATKRQARKKERKKALLQPYTRNKNFDTTGAHKTQPANEGFKVPCNNIQTVVLLWICQQLSRSKNKILVSKRTKSSLDHRKLVVFLLLHKNLQASKSHVDGLTLSKGVVVICTENFLYKTASPWKLAFQNQKTKRTRRRITELFHRQQRSSSYISGRKSITQSGQGRKKNKEKNEKTKTNVCAPQQQYDEKTEEEDYWFFPPRKKIK